MSEKEPISPKENIHTWLHRKTGVVLISQKSEHFKFVLGARVSATHRGFTSGAAYQSRPPWFSSTSLVSLSEDSICMIYSSIQCALNLIDMKMKL